MSVEDIVDGLAIIQQKRGRSVDQGDVEMLALAIKELRKGRSGSVPPEAGAPSNETMASHLRAVADDPTSDLYDNEKMWLREAAWVFEAMDMKYVSAPEPQSRAFPTSCPKCGHSTSVHARDQEWKARCLNCNASLDAASNEDQK